MRARGKGRRKIRRGGERGRKGWEGRRREGNRVIISSVMSLHLDSFLYIFSHQRS